MLFSILALAATVSAAALPEAALEERQTCRIATPAELSRARNAFLREEIIPATPAAFNPANANLIPDFRPVSALSVSYANKAVELGNKFSTLETISQPTFSFTAEPGFDPAKTKYSLIMADPDAPNSELPILSPFLHLIISDAQAECVGGQNRITVAPYMFPTPLSVAPHKYTFLIYRQPPNYVPPPMLQNLPGLRARFPLLDYVKNNNLTGPIAGNFYLEGLGNIVDLGTRRTAVEKQMSALEALQ
ncbi:Putative phosphatidylethanolamine-binding protein [Septoria linicola]|uniref:Phosphatidylethanolamine-binding protein n=1 Tax=Septoria linicola TaxID=215465 RepID=A0A9Q9AVJ6_9PEZI|nr:Putative phosphatidylethanolamine-binding protein [Septoria linicola]